MLTELSSDLFYACGRLESVVIPPRVTKVAVGAFAYCRNLKTVYAPRALQGQIQSAAFVYGASDVTIVYYTPIEITFDATMGTMPDGRCAWTLPFPGDMPMGNLPLPTRDSCEFIGWFTAAAGGVQVTPETAAAIDATYYAHWSTNVYMVRFDANDGNGDMPALVMKPGSVCILQKCAFTPPAGKRFAGWACSNGRRYDDGMLVFDLAKPGETMTMTAIWE